MIKINRSYDFYDMPEDQRIALIGKTLWVKSGDSRNIYIPIGLTNADFNYGVAQGLIYISPIMNYNGENWFRVAASSPDDLDKDLDFFGDEQCKLRPKVIKFLQRLHKFKVTYDGVLESVQEHFNAGKRTS